ncbi:MAG: DNA-3-methyladenine glycosylase 2 family protein [Ilumatobacteraceae bacterium]
MPSALVRPAAGASAAPPERPMDLQRTLGWHRNGRRDPTTGLGPASFMRASWTPDGPATMLIDWSGAQVRVDTWGPGGDHAGRAALGMLALDRIPQVLGDHHPLVTTAARRFGGVRTGASGDLYHALLPTILAQRVTSGEASAQWARLCRELGEPAPGPDLGLLLPPRPDRLVGRPAWWFHPLGIEGKRARALTEVARLADRLWEWVDLPLAELAAKLALVSGIGVWTIGSVLGPVRGDDDAVVIGDYHLPNMVAWNLAGEPRADDARMLDLLAPYRGQRGRVQRLIAWGGQQAPAFGPRRRILPMYRW